MSGPLPDRLGDPALQPLWTRTWKAMARSGASPWRERTIGLPVDDDAVRRAVAGLLGRPIRAGTATVRVGLGELDELLRRADERWGLVRVVEVVGGPLPDRAGDAARQRAEVAAAVDAARSHLGIARSHLDDTGRTAGWTDAWLDDLQATGMAARLHGRGEVTLIGTAAQVLARLPADGVPLPALAAAVTGDTKALAGTTLEGLVLRALALRAATTTPQTAAERRALWEGAGVVPDDLASQVLVLGVPAARDGVLGGWLADAAEAGLPFRITLHQLVRSPVTLARRGPVFACENPAVLRAAAEQLGAATAPLVCTEGRPSVACLRLLRALVDSGGELRAHTDLDWAGLRIAGALIDEFGATPWRMGASDYLDAAARIGAGRPPLRGPAAASPWDPALATAMAETDVAVHEEDVLDTLLSDLHATPRR